MEACNCWTAHLGSLGSSGSEDGTKHVVISSILTHPATSLAFAILIVQQHLEDIESFNREDDADDTET